MRHLILPALLTLSACQTTPAVRVETVEVLKPVAVSCVKRDQLPQEPSQISTLPPDARQAADLLGAKLIDVRGWGRKQAALLIGCVGD